MTAIKIRTDIKESIELVIESNKEKLRILELIPVESFSQAFPEATFSFSWTSSFEVSLPMRQSLIQEVKEFIKTQFPDWHLSYERQYVWDNSQSAGYFIDYYMPNRTSFNIAFRSSTAGSTCVLNQIGTKVVPVYEAVCSQEAADEFSMPLKEGK